MDRLFVLETEYCLNPKNYEGVLINFAVNNLCTRYLDSYQYLDFENACDDTILRVLYESADVLKHACIVPIGSIDFVQKFLSFETKQRGRMKPIEIPDCFCRFLLRHYKVVLGKDFSRLDYDPDVSFVKDVDHLKRFNSSLCLTPSQVKENIDPDTHYAVTESVAFASEWRVFVYHDEILGIECYQGDAFMFPDKQTVLQMVDTYSKVCHPEAYTLDIGVRTISRCNVSFNTDPVIRIFSHQDITEPIEIHPFCAVGLYGFYDHHLLDMWDKGYHWYFD